MAEKKYGRAALILSLLLVTSCERAGSSLEFAALPSSDVPARIATAPLGFECPSPHTVRVVGRERRVYQGADERDPFVCLVRLGRNDIRVLGNFWRLPTPDDAAIRRGLAELWPLTPGKNVSYTFRDHQAGEVTQVRHTWRIIGEQQAHIAGVERRVFALEQDVEFVFSNELLQRCKSLYDMASRLFILRECRVVRGQLRGEIDWIASQISMP